MFGILGLALVGLLAVMARWVDSSKVPVHQRDRLGGTDGAHLRKTASR